MPKKKEQQTYPDVSRLLASYEGHERKLAALSWEEKVAIIERMRAELREWHPPGTGRRMRASRGKSNAGSGKSSAGKPVSKLPEVNPRNTESKG